VSSSLIRALIVAGVVTFSVTACGRRGALESPPDPKATVQQTDKKVDNNQSDDDDQLAAPVGQAKKRPKGFVIPKEPFILDPLQMYS
jgi:predicted small lipoprotein YifL